MSVQVSAQHIPPDPDIIQIGNITGTIDHPERILRTVFPIPGKRVHRFGITSIGIFHTNIIFTMTVQIKIQLLITIVSVSIIKRICPGTTAQIEGLVIIGTANVIIVIKVIYLYLT